MDEKTQAKEDLKKILDAGVAVQTVAAIVTYALQAGKLDFLKKLNELLTEFQNGLNEAEKQEVKQAVDQAVSERSAELLLRMGEELSEEELTEALGTMQDIASGK